MGVCPQVSLRGSPSGDLSPGISLCGSLSADVSLGVSLPGSLSPRGSLSSQSVSPWVSPWVSLRGSLSAGLYPGVSLQASPSAGGLSLSGSLSPSAGVSLLAGLSLSEGPSLRVSGPGRGAGGGTMGSGPLSCARSPRFRAASLPTPGSWGTAGNGRAGGRPQSLDPSLGLTPAITGAAQAGETLGRPCSEGEHGWKETAVGEGSLLATSAASAACNQSAVCR